MQLGEGHSWLRWQLSQRSIVCSGNVVLSLSCIQLFATHGLQSARLLSPWDSSGKSIGVGCHFLLQGIFLTQGLNLHLLHWQADSLPLSHQGNPLFCTFRKWWTLKRSIDCIWLSYHRPWQSMVGDVIAILRSVIQLYLNDYAKVKIGLWTLFTTSPDSHWREGHWTPQEEKWMVTQGNSHPMSVRGGQA